MKRVVRADRGAPETPRSHRVVTARPVNTAYISCVFFSSCFQHCLAYSQARIVAINAMKTGLNKPETSLVNCIQDDKKLKREANDWMQIVECRTGLVI